MELIIRSATTSDLNVILDIYNAAVKHTTAVYDYEERTQEAHLLWYENKVKSNFPVLVAIENENVVGFASYGQFRPWAAYQHTVEHSIYVSENSRGMGIGTALLAELINDAKQNYHAMIAGVDASNIESIKLHEKFNFVQVGLLKEVGWKFNRWLDLALMELIFDGEIKK